jgi:hypothetical protein
MADDRPADPTVLERRYRRLLFAYPAPYRSARGDEIVATLLDLARPRQRAPRVAEAVDLVAGGVRQRLRASSIAGLAGGLAVAAPVALTLAAGISAFAWWRVEPARAEVYIGASRLFGVFRTLGPVAYAAWLLAALGRAVLRPAVSRFVVVVAVVVTVVVVPLLAVVTSVDRPPLWILMALAAFGVLALGGTAVPATDERLAVTTGAVAFALSASAVTLAWPPPGGGWGYYYQPTIARVGAVVAATVAVVAVVGVVRLVRGQPADEWLWATALLGLPAGWLGPFDSAALWLPGGDVVPRFGRLAQVLLATCVAVATMSLLARRRGPGGTPAQPPGPRALARAGAVAAGTAAGLAALVGLATTGLAGGAPAGHSHAVPAHVVVTLAVLGLVGLVGWLPGGARPWLPTCWALLGAAAAAFVGSWLVAVYGNDWTVRGWADVAHTAGLAATIAFVPLAYCAATAARVLRAPGARRPATRRAAAMVLAFSVGWLGYLTLPHLLRWGPALLVFAACAVVLAVADRRTVR